MRSDSGFKPYSLLGVPRILYHLSPSAPAGYPGADPQALSNICITDIALQLQALPMNRVNGKIFLYVGEYKGYTLQF